MQRSFHGLLLRSSEPYKAGHQCSAQNARDLNAAHAERLRQHARTRAKDCATQEDLDAWVRVEEPRLLAHEYLASGGSGLRNQGGWKEQGVEKALRQVAREELERQVQIMGGLPTLQQQGELLARLVETPRVIEEARRRTMQEGLTKRKQLARLLDLDEDWRGG